MTVELRPSFISRHVLRGRYVFVDLAPKRGVDFAIVCAGREECAPGYVVERQGFRYHAMEYVVSGRWELCAGGERQVLGPGAVFTYGPRTRYALRALDDRNLVKCFVDFAGRRARGLISDSGLRAGEAGWLGSSRWVHGLFDQILDGANLSRAAARRSGTLLTEALLLRIREDLRRGAGLPSESERSYLRCRAYVQEHCLALRSVEEVAVACHLDAAYVSRLFRRFGEEGAHQYLMRLKMDHAAELIVRQGYAVKQAAAAVGFGDPYHFSRAFKRVHGVAPGHLTATEAVSGGAELQARTNPSIPRVVRGEAKG